MIISSFITDNNNKKLFQNTLLKRPRVSNLKDTHKISKVSHGNLKEYDISDNDQKRYINFSSIFQFYTEIIYIQVT